MSPSDWGPPTWLLLHAMVEKMNDVYFPEISVALFQVISQICKNLPCPECAGHATEFLNSVKMNTIQTKQNFRMMLFVFHNKVNTRKKKPVFDVDGLDKYATVNLHVAFNMFVAEYTKRHGNFKLMADTSVRKRIVQTTATWLNQNYSKFI